MTTKARTRAIEQVRKNGFVDVSQRDSLAWSRRQMLREMEIDGTLKLNVPIAGSRLYYTAGDNFPVGHETHEEDRDSNPENKGLVIGVITGIAGGLPLAGITLWVLWPALGLN